MSRQRFYSEIGSHMRPTYAYKMVGGKKTLVKTGETNFYEQIQVGAEDCTVKALIKRASLGDTSALNQNISYGDLSKYPKDLAAFSEMQLQAEMDFNSLPKEIKEEFDNSYTVFLHDMINGTAEEKFKKFEKVVDADVSANSVVNNSTTEEIKGVNYDK